MTETTVYCTAETGGLSANKNNGDFTGCLSGAGSESWSDNQWRHTVGNFWHSNNRANIGYMVLEFDLSGIPSGDTVSAAELQLYGQQDQSNTDFDILIAEFSPAAPWDSSDWQNGTDLAALTDLASINTSSFNASGYNTFTSAALATAVDGKASSFRIIVWSSATEAASWPGAANTYDSVNFYSYGQTGTTQDPKLVITHAAGSSNTDVNAASESLTFTAQGAAIGLDVGVNAQTEALSLTPSQASISLNAGVNASAFALSISAHSASVSIDSGVSSSTAGLTFSTQQASVSSDVNVAAGITSLNVTANAATISTAAATIVEAATEALNLAAQPASLTYDVGVLAQTETLQFSGNPAIVSLASGISAVPAILQVGTSQASIGYVAGVNLQVAHAPLILVPHRAEIDAVRIGRGGDDAPGMFTGEAKRFFYDKQTAELGKIEKKVKQLKKTPPKRRVEQARAAFEPFQAELPQPIIEPLVDELARFERQETNYRQFRDAVSRYVEAVEQEKQVRRKRQNNDAAVALLFAA